jgi:hypothetical protein
VFIIFGEVRRGGREKNDYMVLVSGWCGGACRSRWESGVALLRRIDVGDIIPFHARWARLVKRHVACCGESVGVAVSNDFLWPKGKWIQLYWMYGA